LRESGYILRKSRLDINHASYLWNKELRVLGKGETGIPCRRVLLHTNPVLCVLSQPGLDLIQNYVSNKLVDRLDTDRGLYAFLYLYLQFLYLKSKKASNN